MINLFGTTCLWLALIVALFQVFLPAIGYCRHAPRLLATARPLVLAQAAFIFAAYFLLTMAFVNNDFSIAYVATNSHPALPLIYRLTALWGAHEGSILLWIFILNIWSVGTSYIICQKNNLFSLIVSILGIISGCFLCFLLFTSNPFIKATTIITPQDLNPLLQDPGFVIHPPMLYMGYVGLSIAFAITEASLLIGDLNTTWVSLTRRFALIAWCFLTLGITLGSWWAYRVLGWGGFWFWDPVENASLLPWLAATALLHTLVLVEKRHIAKNWAALLSIICFSLSLLGTFLVRSGLLVSSHTFANDPARGVFLLILLTLLISASLTVYVIRLPILSASSTQTLFFSWLSREMLLLLNSVLLFVMMLTVLLGTLYPLIIDALHLGSISVGAPYFNQVMFPFAVLVLGLILVIFFRPWFRFKLFSAMTFAHSGFIVLMIGVILSSFFSEAKSVRLQTGRAVTLGPYQFFFLKTEGIEASNYRGIQATFEVLKASRHIAYLMPEKRIYTVRDMVMTKVDIHPGVFRDLYIALGEPFSEQDWSIRIYYKPFVRWIWLGAFLMIIGGLLALWQQKRDALLC